MLGTRANKKLHGPILAGRDCSERPLRRSIWLRMAVAVYSSRARPLHTIHTTYGSYCAWLARPHDSWLSPWKNPLMPTHYTQLDIVKCALVFESPMAGYLNQLLSQRRHLAVSSHGASYGNHCSLWVGTFLPDRLTDDSIAISGLSLSRYLIQHPLA